MACPICHKAGAEKFSPFCSRRCADIDLGRWFSGSYAVTSEASNDEEELPDLESPPTEERH